MMHQSSLDFEAFVKVIHDMFTSAKARFAAIADRESCMDMVKESVREYNERVNSDEDNVVDFTSWCGFPLYDIDFGWGKPDLVSNACNPVRKIVLIDSKSEGGIDAWITLSQEEKVLLEQDPDIVASLPENSVGRSGCLHSLPSKLPASWLAAAIATAAASSTHCPPSA
ncbi:hypothetical protein NL676_039197 [Syzygium grande]|nr:hypothetical protein NL676_039197 [Syzygium grande]